MATISPSRQQVATVTFNVPLGADAAQERELKYNRGVEFLQGRFPTIEIVERLPAFFSLTIRGQSQLIADLQQLLEAERIATVATEDPERPIFRAVW
jgi:hypothetical protein